MELYINTVTGRDFVDRGDYDQLSQLIKECDYEGMQTMNDVMFNLVKEGIITPETAIKFSPSSNEMSQLLRGKEENLIAANREAQESNPRNSFGSGTQYSGSYKQNPNRPPQS
jgi:Tfp pilus assembly ATPase PilU